MYKVAAIATPHLSRLMALFAAVVVVSVFLYGFLLLEAVGHTAARTAAEKEIRAISSELGGLEARYLSHTKEVTPELAGALGFVTPTETTVVFATSYSRTLSLGTIEGLK